MFQAAIVVLGLMLFEIISSADNAIINAHVLKTLPEKYRKIFLFWGILFAVFVVRGCLPFLIVWFTNNNLSFGEIWSFVFSGNERVKASVEASKPFLLLGGGVYLFLVFLAWLFLEEKKYAFLVEGFIHRRGFWFYAIASIFLTAIVYYSIKLRKSNNLSRGDVGYMGFAENRNEMMFAGAVKRYTFLYQHFILIFPLSP